MKFCNISGWFLERKLCVLHSERYVLWKAKKWMQATTWKKYIYIHIDIYLLNNGKSLFSSGERQLLLNGSLFSSGERQLLLNGNHFLAPERGSFLLGLSGKSISFDSRSASKASTFSTSSFSVSSSSFGRRLPRGLRGALGFLAGAAAGSGCSAAADS